MVSRILIVQLGEKKAPQLSHDGLRNFLRRGIGERNYATPFYAFRQILLMLIYLAKAFAGLLAEPHGRRDQILQERKEVQTQTLQRRKRYNQQLRELAESADSLHKLSDETNIMQNGR